MKNFGTKRTMWIVFTITILIWTFGGFAPYLFFSTSEERGTFGDMFGAINSFSSILAFAGLIYTILQQNESINMQRIELELQREELKANRLEMERSATAQEESGIILAQQLESMKLSAKLNAYTTLLNATSDKIMISEKNTFYNYQRSKLIKEKDNYEEKIKSIINRLN